MIKFKRIFTHPAILAIIFGFLWEWLRLDFKTINNFNNDPSSALIGFAFLYAIGYVLALGYQRLTSETEFFSEATLRKSLQEIIEESKEYLYLVSPYLDPGNVLLEAIIKAARRGVDVKLIHNSNQIMKSHLAKDFTRLLDSGVTIYNHPRLHSKVYHNEQFSLVCSLNLVTSSYSNSFESGILSTRRPVRKQVLEYIDDTILGSDQCSRTMKEQLPQSEGFCISTKKPIPFNIHQPVEYNEYKANSGNLIGKYCHSCSCEVSTSLQQPLCATCQDLHGRLIGSE